MAQMWPKLDTQMCIRDRSNPILMSAPVPEKRRNLTESGLEIRLSCRVIFWRWQIRIWSAQRHWITGQAAPSSSICWKPLILSLIHIFKRFRLVIVLVILFIIELAIVPSLETTRLNNAQASDAGLELVRAESLGAQDGQIRLRVYFQNKGTQTASYPYLQGEAAGDSIYLSFDESLQPSGSTIIAEIPPKTEAAGCLLYTSRCV